jgi:hypothetical protein
MTTTLSVGIACDVLAALNLTATIEVNVGAPFSLELTLSDDRWLPTYPS